MTDVIPDNKTTLSELDKAIQQSIVAQPQRNYLGMSQIGKQDDRTLWLQFRGCLPTEYSPRVERIFRLGDAIENELIRYLRAIPNVELHTHDEAGNQFRFELFGGHFSGAMDGAITGIPESPRKYHVFEAKSASDKRFNELVVKQVKQWSPEYYAQLQCYMGVSGMDSALFCAYNKDDSRIYTELVPFNSMEWDFLQVKALRLIESDHPPTSKYRDKTWYEAKWMSPTASAIYWQERLPARVHCMNCRFSKPDIHQPSGRYWICCRQNILAHIPETVKSTGCTYHQWIPALLPLELIDLNDDFATYRLTNGHTIKNGQDDFLSNELSQASVTGFDDMDKTLLNQREQLDTFVPDCNQPEAIAF